MSIQKLLTRLLRDEKGMSSVEYGMICALIILAMLTALSSMAGVVKDTWNDVSSKTSSAINQSTAS
jgi:pilus assembly protein Flp/PilA